MPTSIAQVSANRRNAKKSTGPLTVVGKQTVSRNSIKHGIFAKDMVLPHEDAEAYNELLDQLESELKPQGILEQVLVERIALAIWRQKRLVRAEAAYLASEMSQEKIAAAVSQIVGPSQPVTPAELSGDITPGMVSWCHTILQEIDHVDRDNWRKSAPLLLAYLSQEAEANQQEINGYLLALPDTYLDELARYCRRQLRLAQRQALVADVANMVKGQRAILKENMRESLARYQMLLDNQLLKSIKVLMELKIQLINCTIG